MTRDHQLQDMLSLPAQADADTTNRMLAVMNKLSGR